MVYKTASIPSVRPSDINGGSLGRVLPRQTSTGVTRGVQQLGSPNVYSDGGSSQIIVKDTVPRVLMGNQKTFGEGFYVSKPTIDVLTNIDPNQLIFNSNQNVFKIVSSGTTTTPVYNVTGTTGQWNNSVGGGPGIVTHNLGYIPGVIAYVDYGGQYVLLPTTFQSISGFSAAIFNRVSINVTSTSLYILDTTITNGAVATYASGGLNIRYYLLQETAS